jgi:murein DD-endopeptidase MepM/ murein hydrolase activator NlpD
MLGSLLSAPSRADTASDLNSAKAKLASLQSQLDRLTISYAQAQAKLARTESRVDQVRGHVVVLRQRMRRIRSRLDERARVAYEGGATGALELLLTSASFSDFSDRLEFLGRVEQGDGDVLVQAKVTAEQLRRSEQDLRTLSASQAATVTSLRQQSSQISAALGSAQSLVSQLQHQLAQQLADHGPIHPGWKLQSCPVGQPRSFADSFGNPRPGGRTHQGIDMMAPFGTTIYAAQTGRFERNTNSLGGMSALVYAGGGDYTYYAHMSSYAGVASGSIVSAGTPIGHVGNTGDAAGGPYHLHFEYHPGGGGAVDPYNLLRAVCG